MSMYCHQCEEAANGTGCRIKGVCGKSEKVSNLQDLLIYTIKGIALVAKEGKKVGLKFKEIDYFIMNGLFMTITNVNFHEDVFLKKIEEGLYIRENIKSELNKKGLDLSKLHDAANWMENSRDKIQAKADSVKTRVLATKDEDIISLRELIVYGIKGIAAYLEHAYNLGEKSDKIMEFMIDGLAVTLDDTLGVDELLSYVLKTGEYGVIVMALLDKANTKAYGNPEITKVNIGTRNNPAILISGHDLKDLEQLLKQTQGEGVDVYTHGEMLPAHYYPELKKYPNLVGNYGNAWWK